MDVAERAGLPLIIAGIIQDQDYFERYVEPRLDGERVATSVRSGPERRGDAPRRGAGASAPRQLRRAVRLQRRRSNGLRHAGHRPSARLDARNRPRRCERFPGRLSRGGRRRRACGRLAGQDASCAPRSSVASTRTGWSTTTSSVYHRVVALDHARRAGNVPDPRSSNDRFRLGVNYWPARTAMGWWSDFDRPEVAADFARIAASGLDSVRIFLTWADFQPAPNQVDRRMLDRLIAVADLAAGSRVWRSFPRSSPVT